MNSFRTTAQNSSERISCLQMHQTHGLPCLGCDVWGLSQVPKTKSITELKTLEVIWDSLPQAPINKAVTEEMHKSWQWTVKHTKWLSNVRQSVHGVVSEMLFCCFGTNIFSMQKSLSGHT